MNDIIKENILLVDDDKFLLDMYAMKFTKEGYNVQTCFSVPDALDCLRRGFAAGAVIFDITMPEHDGFSLLQTMRDEHLAEHALKIALTNQNSDQEKAHALELGASLYLIKATLIPSEVVSTVRSALAGAHAA